LSHNRINGKGIAVSIGKLAPMADAVVERESKFLFKYSQS
jgi:hypothetical protein